MQIISVLLLLVASPLARPGVPARPIKVFILAGQSNMEGQAVADLDGKDYNDGKGTLSFLLHDAVKAVRFRHLGDGAGRWAVRDDVWVRYKPEDEPVKAGPLTLGFTPYPGRHHFGPELELGHVLGDYFDGQVLLIKTAWGGKSLYQDFRPPSSGGTVGPYYTKMLAEVREALESLKTDFPAYDGGGHELAGLVWYQGWNDGVSPDKGVPEYEQNLVNLIKDLRKDLNAPRLPVVVGELTGPWVEAPGEWAALRRAQAAAAARPEFRGSVVFVETHDFVRKPEDSPNPGHGHHEFGNAETYFLVGDALGKGLLELLGAKTAAGYRTQAIEGWNALVSERLLGEDAKATANAIDLLRAQLKEIVRIVPASAVTRLREVPLWLSPEYPGAKPRAEYHPGREWLVENHRNPAMVKGIEFTNVAIFEPESRRMPNFALHELAHAYHDRVLGFDHAEIKAAFERAKAGKTYDSVERWHGDGRPNTVERAYAMTNAQEYFAESTEAFFSRNDFFPFTREELRRHDPAMEELLLRLWSVAPAATPSPPDRRSQ